MKRPVCESRNWTIRFLTLLGAWLLLAGPPVYADVSVRLEMGNAYAPVNQRQKNYVRVALVGQAPDAKSDAKKRAPANVALVLDRSGSMTGEKLQKAQQAAILMLDRLDANDIVSLVSYDDQIEVVVPATKLTDRERFRAAIRSLYARSSTALYGAVQTGAAEVGKFAGSGYVNRIVLLSDGIANVGPSSPAELAALGEAMAKRGISVTTIGVGLDFNEDLMTKLAAKSDGNHLFAERPEDILTAFGEESRDVTTVVAKNLSINLTLDPRVHVVRALGRDAWWQGQKVYAGLTQLTSGQTKYVLLEVDVDPLAAIGSVPAGSVKVDYADALTNGVATKQAGAQITATESPEQLRAGENRDVMECVVAQLAVETSESAMRQRDTGQVQQSQKTLEKNAQYLQNNAAKYNSKALENMGKTTSEQASKVVDDEQWKSLRKSMTKGGYDVKQQTGK